MADIKMIQAIIAEQNPWWKDGLVPSYLALEVERPLAQHLWKYVLSAGLRRYVVIVGPRRVGKTTTMYQTVRHLLKHKPPGKVQWVRLDHPIIRRFDLGVIVKEAIKLAKAGKKHPLYLFLDELAYADHWDKWLKTFYDEHWPVNIIASSSASAALHKGSESGIGRWEEFHLTPYVLTELLKLYNPKITFPMDENNQSLYSTIMHLFQSLTHTEYKFEKERKILMSFGGFPEFLVESKRADSNKQSINLFFQKTGRFLRSDAIERAIYKDIPLSYTVISPVTLERLLYVLAEQCTGLLSPTGISKDVSGVSVATIERYIHYLAQSYLIFTISNYDNNEKNVQRRQKKVYFVDVAIRNAALLKTKEQIFNNPSVLGKIQENMVAGHLYHLGKKSNIRLYHWRRGKHEVDFIYDDPVQPLAFEIGSSKGYSHAGFKKFLQENPKFKNRCYYIAPDVPFLPAEDSPSGIGEIPLDLLLLATGLQQDIILSLKCK